MPWIVHATPPAEPWKTGWDFRHGYFPRKHHYKKDAKELAEEAVRKGGLNVRIENAKKEKT